MIGQRGDGLGELLVQRGDRAQARLVFGKRAAAAGSWPAFVSVTHSKPLPQLSQLCRLLGSQIHQPLDELGIDGTA